MPVGSRHLSAGSTLEGQGSPAVGVTETRCSSLTQPRAAAWEVCQCPETYLDGGQVFATLTSSEHAPRPSSCGFEGRECVGAGGGSQGPITTSEPCGLGEELVAHHTSVSSSQKQDHSFIHSFRAYVSAYFVPDSMLDSESKDTPGTEVQQRSQHTLPSNAREG